MKLKLKRWDLEGISLAAAIIGIIILYLVISFFAFTFGYWLITLILAGFFNFILPFWWSYAFGAWLIAFILGSFINFKIDFDM